VPGSGKHSDKEKRRGITKNVLDIWGECYKKRAAIYPAERNFRLKKLWQYRRILGSRQFAATLWHSRKNVLAADRELPPVAGPYMAELDITYRCNCRCLMCQRWQDPRRDELTLAEYRNLAHEFSALHVYQVSIAGGEPLLRDDLPSIIAVFARLGMSVNVCTNGTLLEERAEDLRHEAPPVLMGGSNGASGA
jgi:sulfatase maturation enzyme AslB (radical SAM superfamily)